MFELHLHLLFWSHEHEESIAEFCKHRDLFLPPAACSLSITLAAPRSIDTTLGIVCCIIPCARERPTCPLKPRNILSLLARKHRDHVDLTSGRLSRPCSWILLPDTCHRIWPVLSLGTGRRTYCSSEKALDSVDIPGRRYSSITGSFRQVPTWTFGSCDSQSWCLPPESPPLPYRQAYRPYLLAFLWYVSRTIVLNSLANMFPTSTRPPKPLAVVPPFLRSTFIPSQALQLLRPERVYPEF